jgi:hypothetical protein
MVDAGKRIERPSTGLIPLRTCLQYLAIASAAALIRDRQQWRQAVCTSPMIAR